MNKKKAANVAGGKNVLVVTADNSSKNKKFDVKDIQDVTPVTETKAEEKPQEQPQAVEAPTAETTTQENNVIKAERRIPTMQELKDSVTTLYLLQEKHSQLITKRASLNKFAITHQKDNAEAVITDANGEEFRSCSPKTIAKLIEFWKEEFDEAINEVESQLKQIFLGEAA